MADRKALAPDTIRQRIHEAIDALCARPPTPGLEPFEEDRRTFLRSASSIGQPRLFTVGGVPARYLTPLFWGETVGGIVSSEPIEGEIIAWPSWGPGPAPLFTLTMAQIDRMLERSDPRVAEFVPRAVATPARFAVDPPHLAGATMLERYEALPFKNQEDRYTYVAAINASRRMKTRWRYNAGLQEPSYKCLSYASSTVADWWGLILGHPITQRYTNFVNGIQEYGADPRGMEVLYHHRAATIGRPYRLAPRAHVTLDPVTRERIPISSTAYAELLCTPPDLSLPDPLTRDGEPSYEYHTGMYHQDGPPLPLFDRGRADEDVLKAAIRRHGIVLAFTQARLLRFIRVGLHGIPIIGHFERNGETVFIYHESYGNHGPGYIWDNLGGPSYMSIPARLLRDATTFPHRLWIDAQTDEQRGGGGGEAAIAITVTHSQANPMVTPPPRVTTSDGTTLPVSAAGAGRWRIPFPGAPRRVRVTVERDYFYHADGSPMTCDILVTAKAGRPGEGGSLDPLTRWLMVEGQIRRSASPVIPAHIERRRAEVEAELASRRRGITGGGGGGSAAAAESAVIPLMDDQERALATRVLPERLARHSG